MTRIAGIITPPLVRAAILQRRSVMDNMTKFPEKSGRDQGLRVKAKKVFKALMEVVGFLVAIKTLLS